MFRNFFGIFREREIYNSLREGFVYRFNLIKVFHDLWPEGKPDKRLVLSLSKIGGGTRMCM